MQLPVGILCPVGTVTLDSPHPGFDPALPEECDPSGGRLVRESLEIVSLLLLLRPNTFKPLLFLSPLSHIFTKGHNTLCSRFLQAHVVALVYLWRAGCFLPGLVSASLTTLCFGTDHVHEHILCPARSTVVDNLLNTVIGWFFHVVCVVTSCHSGGKIHFFN